MKNLFRLMFALIAISINCRSLSQSSDLTASMLGIPQELFDITKNLTTVTNHTGGFVANNKYVKKDAATIKKENDAYKIALRAARANKTALPVAPAQYEWKTTFSKVSSDTPFGTSVLNWVHDMIWVFGYEYVGYQDGKYVIHKYHGDFLASDMNWYSDFDSWFYIYQDGDQWILSGDNDLPKFVYDVPAPELTYKTSSGQTVIPNKKVQFTAEQIALSTGLTVTQVYDWEIDYRVCELRDPSKYVTSMFPRFDDSGNFYTYISGKRSDLVQFSSLIYYTGTKWSDYDVQMIAINDCPIPEVKTSDTDWRGDGGRCYAMWYETENDAQAFSYNFDYSKEHVVIVFAVELSSGSGWPNGHYDRFHAYYDMKHSRVMQSPSDK